MMRWIKMFSVRRSDQGSGFRDPVPTMACRVSIPRIMAHLPNWDFIIWPVATCHLAAQYGRVNSFEDHELLDTTLVYHPEEHMCLL